jgi:hypothetical protein
MLPPAHDELSPEMVEAMKALDDRGVLYRRTSRHQLKVRTLNFWPCTGAITEDDYGRRQERGLDGFLTLVALRRIVS